MAKAGCGCLGDGKQNGNVLLLAHYANFAPRDVAQSDVHDSSKPTVGR